MQWCIYIVPYVGVRRWSLASRHLPIPTSFRQDSDTPDQDAIRGLDAVYDQVNLKLTVLQPYPVPWDSLRIVV